MKSLRYSLLLTLILPLLSLGCDGTASVDNDSDQTQDALADVGVDTNQDAGVDTTQEWTTNDQLSAEELEFIGLQREAIDTGLGLGKQTLTTEINIELGGMGIPTSYLNSTSSGVDYMAPSPTDACPFLETNTGESIDCRAIADRATISAHSRMEAVKTENPLEDKFQNERREENEFWYGQGMETGVDNEAIIALGVIRDMGLCDQNPEPTASAYEAGVEEGRQLYVEELNEVFAEAGIAMNYPEEINQIDVCQADQSFLMPARSEALAKIETRATTSPLCEDYNPVDPNEVNQLAEAREQYEEGMNRGITTEHSLAEEKIFRVVPCNVGDPLVFDLNGDGVTLIPVYKSQTDFDLFGVQDKVRTAWIQADDALLVLDKDGNGNIDNGRELFANFIGEHGYNSVGTGFDHLAIWDRAEMGGNQDGVISTRDQVFSKLQLWNDRNADGLSQADELIGLEEGGVAGVVLAFAPHQGEDTQLTHRGQFIRNAKGMSTGLPQMGEVYDAWFKFGRSDKHE